MQLNYTVYLSNTTYTHEDSSHHVLCVLSCALG